MTQEEIDEMKEDIHKGMLMVMEKAELFGKSGEFTLDELSMMSDIVKDMAESLKNLAKTHALLAEHSVKKY